MLFSFGSVGVVGGGGGCEVEEVASVANHRELPDRSAELRNGKGKCEVRGGGIVVSIPMMRVCVRAHREKFTREAERTTEERRL